MFNKIHAIRDYLINGLEHDSDSDAREYLTREFGLNDGQAARLVELGLNWMKSMIQFQANLAIERIIFQEMGPRKSADPDSERDPSRNEKRNGGK